MRNFGIIVVLIAFALIFSLISIPNHYNFRTAALDYGMFNQAMFAYSHGHEALFTQSIDGSESKYLCDHFSPIIALLSPLYVLFGSYALLVIQIFFLLMGALFVYRLALLKGYDLKWSLTFACLFLSIWGIYGSLSFDFHTNVIASSLLPVIVFYFFSKKWWQMSVVFLLALLCKENSGILLFFLFLLLTITSDVERQLKRVSFLFASLAALWVAIVLFFLMPAQCAGHLPNVEGFYHTFGNNFGEAFIQMIKSPLKVFRLFYEDTDGNLAKTKITTYWWLLLSGGVFVLLVPRFLVLIIPVLAQKFLSSNSLLWDINGHYSMEFVPIIVLAAIALFQKRTNTKFGLALLMVSVMLALFMSWRGVIGRTSKSNIFKKEHFTSLFNREHFGKVISYIPSDAVLSCTTPLAPHISDRRKVYLFPNYQKAEYVLLHKKGIETYPMNVASFEEIKSKLLQDSTMKIIHENGDFLLFQNMMPSQ